MTTINAFELIHEKDKSIALNLKAHMMILIRVKIENKRQDVIAEILGVHQPRVSDLMNGKIDEFSIEMLISFLVKLNIDFTLDLKVNTNSEGE